MRQRNENPEQRFKENGTEVMTDGSGNDPEETEETQQEEGKDSRGLFSRVKDRVGIGANHEEPENTVDEKLSENSDVESAQELSEELEDFDEVVEAYDSTRSDLEADLQATAQSYETVISEDAGEIAEKLNAVFSVARSDLAHTYDFNPESGEHSLDYEEPEESETATDYELDMEEGLATFLSKGARMGDQALNHFSELQGDMQDLAEDRDELNEKLENLKERNEDQLESSRSEFTTEKEQERAETIRDAENDADEESINSQLSEINDELSRKRPRKEEHLEVGNNVLGEVRDTYNQHASQVESAVREISDEVGYLTDALDQLTDVEIGSMEEMLEDAFANTDVDLGAVGKYLQDAEGDLKNAYREAVNDLTVQVARQYAQAEKAIEELDVVEDSISQHTDRIDLDAASDLEEMLDDAYDGEDMEAYLEERVEGVLDATYSARDEIRSTFRGLEQLRDDQQLAE